MTDSAEKPTAPPESDSAKTGIASDITDLAKRGQRGLRKFAKDLWDDLDLWINAGAARAGFSAITVSAIIAVTYLATLPFALAAVGVVACCTLVGVGAYGIIVGGRAARDRVIDLYRNSRGLPPKERKPDQPRDLLSALRQSKPVQKIASLPVVKKFRETPLYQRSRNFAHKRQAALLGSMALGGSAASIAFGVMLIVTNVMLLPIIAGAAIIALTGYTTAHCVSEYIQRAKKAKAETAAATQETAPAAMPASPAAAFSNAANVPVSTNDNARVDVPVKKTEPKP